MTQAVAEDTETSLTEGMESMGVREADKTEKLNQGEEEKETQNDKTGDASETIEETQKEDEGIALTLSHRFHVQLPVKALWVNCVV